MGVSDFFIITLYFVANTYGLYINKITRFCISIYALNYACLYLCACVYMHTCFNVVFPNTVI